MPPVPKGPPLSVQLIVRDPQRGDSFRSGGPQPIPSGASPQPLLCSAHLCLILLPACGPLRTESWFRSSGPRNWFHSEGTGKKQTPEGLFQEVTTESIPGWRSLGLPSFSPWTLSRRQGKQGSIYDSSSPRAPPLTFWYRAPQLTRSCLFIVCLDSPCLPPKRMQRSLCKYICIIRNNKG